MQCTYLIKIIRIGSIYLEWCRTKPINSKSFIKKNIEGIIRTSPSFKTWSTHLFSIWLDIYTLANVIFCLEYVKLFSMLCLTRPGLSYICLVTRCCVSVGMFFHASVWLVGWINYNCKYWIFFARIILWIILNGGVLAWSPVCKESLSYLNYPVYDILLNARLSKVIVVCLKLC